jgi:hypothetical protein
MWLEDDVSVNGVIQDSFRYDLNGHCPNTFNAFWKIDKEKYPFNGEYRWSGHGGSVIHKDNFLKYLKNCTQKSPSLFYKAHPVSYTHPIQLVQ